MPFTAKKAVDQKTVDSLAELFLAAARKIPGYKIVSMTEVQQLLDIEQKKQLMGCSDDSCALEIAGALGADSVVWGELIVFGGNHLTIKRLDARNSRLEAQFLRDVVIEPWQVEKQLLEIVKQAVPIIFPAKVKEKDAQTRVAIIPFMSQWENGRKVANNLGKYFTIIARKLPKIEVVSAAEVDDLIDLEAQKQLLGCADESCIAEISGALNVDSIITGLWITFGGNYLVIKRINARTAKLEAQFSEPVELVEGESNEKRLALAARRAVGAILMSGSENNRSDSGGGPDSDFEHGSEARTWGWVATGGGAGAIAAGGVLLAIGTSTTVNLQKQVAGRRVRNMADLESFNRDADKGKALTVAGAAVLSAGAVAAIVGAIILFNTETPVAILPEITQADRGVTGIGFTFAGRM